MGVGLGPRLNVNDSLTEELHSLTEYLCMCSGGMHHSVWVFLQCCPVYHNISNTDLTGYVINSSEKLNLHVCIYNNRNELQENTSIINLSKNTGWLHIDRWLLMRPLLFKNSSALFCTESLKYLSTDFSTKVYSTYDFSPLLWCTDGSVFNFNFAHRSS